MKKTLSIKGMTCHSCEMLIQDAVEELPGVASCEVSQKKGDAVVDFDESKTSLDEIKKTIEEEGYEVA